MRKQQDRVYTTERLLKDYSRGERSFRRIRLKGKSLADKELSGADFTGATFQCKDFKGTKLAGANFTETNLCGVDFSGADLEGATFARAVLKKTKFHDATLNECAFNSSEFCQVDFSKAKIRQARFEEARFTLDGWTTAYLGSLLSISYLMCIFYLSIGFTLLIFSFEGNPNQSIGSNPSQLVLGHAISIISFLYFYILSIGNDFLKRFTGFLYGIILLSLLMLNQPIITGTAFILMLAWLYQIYWIWKTCEHSKVRLMGALTIIFLLFWMIGILYGYENFAHLWSDENAPEGFIFSHTIVVVIITILWSIITAIFTAAMFFLSQFSCQEPFWKGLIKSLWIVLLYVVALFTPLVLAFIIVRENVWGNDIGYQSIMPIEFMLIALLGILFGLYYGWRTYRDEKNFQTLRDVAVSFCYQWAWESKILGLLSTKFRKADLTGADFSDVSILRHADFTEANLDAVNWQGAWDLKRVRVGKSYLRYAKIRHLLSGSRRPKKAESDKFKAFECLDLQGISLSQLSDKDFFRGVSFRDSNLSRANLSGLDLTGANLSGCILEGVNLSHTQLTGIRIQDWQIDEKTDFTGAKCDYLYLNSDESEEEVKVNIVLKDESEGKSLAEQMRNQPISAVDSASIKAIREGFHKIELTRNRVQKEYQLQKFANEAEGKYQLDPERCCEMFRAYQREKWLAKHNSSWWQRILWFEIEPWIEKANQWTRELDIFPLLENLGRLSIIIAVITFVNNFLKPNIDTEISERTSINRFNLEQLRTSRDGLVGLDVSQALPDNSESSSHVENSSEPSNNRDSGDQFTLREINLRGANLTDANFGGVDLTNADFSGAVLTRANFSGAFLEGAKFSSEHDDSYLPSRSREGDTSIKIPSLLIPNIFKRGASLQEANLLGANLIEADLRNVDLTRADLSRADLTDANLIGADLTDANLIGADLTDANLIGADLTDANLIGADLTDANLIGADLTDANLIGADLTDANLGEADLTDANLIGADLTDANLGEADLTDANLIGADLTDANLGEADLTGAYLTKQLIDQLHEANFSNLKGLDEADKSLRNADLSEINLSDIDLSKNYLAGANLTGANLNRANLTGANLIGARGLTDANLIGADLTGAYLTKQLIDQLREAKFDNLKGLDSVDKNLTHVDLSKVDLSAVDLSENDLRGANLRGANLRGANLRDADLTSANLTSARLWRADLTDADLTDADLTDADLTDADLTDADLTDADLTDADLTEAYLADDALENAILCNTILPDRSIESRDCDRN
ncbi:MAG: pentapeptide repeat-containing protein [Leptolyngbya sp. SIO1E4]|nr:pentapeptide repeat-containing protein [Leptolyngbya sp. SIO1E4]